MHLTRPTIRRAAAAVAAAMAVVYYLIGFGGLTVVRPGSGEADILVFGLGAGSVFLLGAVLLLAFDRRVLWIVGAAFQVFVAWAYVAVAADRTPAFETWGITLRILQLPLFAALVYLAIRPASPDRRVTSRPS